jgi:hypothetical protein
MRSIDHDDYSRKDSNASGRSTTGTIGRKHSKCSVLETASDRSPSYWPSSVRSPSRSPSNDSSNRSPSDKYDRNGSGWSPFSSSYNHSANGSYCDTNGDRASHGRRRRPLGVDWWQAPP